MITTRWWWVRHAPSASSPGIIHGQDDVDADLSDQAAIDARRHSLPEDAVWLTSGLNRAVQTAAARVRFPAHAFSQGKPLQLSWDSVRLKI